MKLCKIENCNKRHVGFGFCQRHYQNYKNYGNPIPVKERTILQRIKDIGWTVTEKKCWEWKGNLNDRGYGTITIGKYGLAKAKAHRVVFEEITGVKIGENILLHSCDNPPCVNPEHLKIGTHKENMEDMAKKGRHWKHARTQCPNGHNLTFIGMTKKINRKDGRKETVCVRCEKDRKRRWVNKKKFDKKLKQ